MTMTKEYTCEYCGCVLTEEEICDFNGHITCEDCGEHLFICDCCGETVDDRDFSPYETEDGDSDIIRIAETEYLEDYCNRRGIDLDDKGVSVVKKCWNAIKGHGDNVKKLDIVHISTESVFYHQQMIDFIERSGEYLRVLGVPYYPGESFRVCYETDFQQHGLLARGFNILPEWIDMTIKENPTQRLRTLEIVAETF